MMPDARMLDYYDRHVSRMISEKYGLDERSAIRAFLESETYRMLITPELEIYALSPVIVFDMWENEKVSGDPRQSVYIRGE
jgi:hypothetical protein